MCLFVECRSVSFRCMRTQTSSWSSSVQYRNFLAHTQIQHTHTQIQTHTQATTFEIYNNKIFNALLASLLRCRCRCHRLGHCCCRVAATASVTACAAAAALLVARGFYSSIAISVSYKRMRDDNVVTSANSERSKTKDRRKRKDKFSFSKFL